VLLTDDNLFNLKAMRLQMEKNYNWELEEAYNGEMACKKVKENIDKAFDIIFMDIDMPVMNGIEAMIAIRENIELKLKNIKPVIIALTGYYSEED